VQFLLSLPLHQFFASPCFFLCASHLRKGILRSPRSSTLDQYIQPTKKLAIFAQVSAILAFIPSVPYLYLSPSLLLPSAAAVTSPFPVLLGLQPRISRSLSPAWLHLSSSPAPASRPSCLSACPPVRPSACPPLAVVTIANTISSVPLSLLLLSAGHYPSQFLHATSLTRIHHVLSTRYSLSSGRRKTPLIAGGASSLLVLVLFTRIPGSLHHQFPGFRFFSPFNQGSP
jgi:hypothetical protein